MDKIVDRPGVIDPSFSLLSLLTNAKNNVKKERKKYNVHKTGDKEIVCNSARSYLAPLYAKAPLRGCQIDLDRITEILLQMSIKGFSTRYISNFQLEFLELSTIINDLDIIQRSLRVTGVSDTLYMFDYPSFSANPSFLQFFRPPTSSIDLPFSLSLLNLPFLFETRNRCT